jgi:hypothetical protein
MDQRTFHGPISPDDFANALIAAFDQGNLNARKVGRGNPCMVQIASSPHPISGGRTALAVHLSKVEDGVHVRVGQQQWTGIAASLGLTALMAMRNPLSILARLDDVAQDVSSIQLVADVWDTIERAAVTLGASYQISERLRRLTCAYCSTANLVGASHCVACGAPMGLSQPIACPKCGHVTSADAKLCPECGTPL